MVKTSINEFMAKVVAKNPGEIEFHQAVNKVTASILPFIEENPKYKQANIIERIVEPEKVIMFRVPWLDDRGQVQVNRGYRIEMNSAVGPYKGGLRFHPTVNIGVLKFLAFEQVFKNSLTGLPMGAGTGGSDFDPKNKSDNEIMYFCQSFMTELFRHIGPYTDIIGGDVGVGGREIGFLFGQYKKLKNEFTGVFTGKGIGLDGRSIRPEATGYGCVYFTEEMLKTRGLSFKSKILAISGSGNVALHVLQKATELGAKVVTLSDSDGYIYDPKGIDNKKLEFVLELKNIRRGRIREYAEKYACSYFAREKPWGVKCNIALPCATQNEIDENDAETLIKNGCICVTEGANMPSTIGAIEVFKKKGILFGPGKASNAGGIAASGLEMSQDAMRLNWSIEESDIRLKKIIQNIHATCVKYGSGKDNFIDYSDGANIGGFVRVANSMLNQGSV